MKEEERQREEEREQEERRRRRREEEREEEEVKCVNSISSQTIPHDASSSRIIQPFFFLISFLSSGFAVPSIPVIQSLVRAAPRQSFDFLTFPMN